MSSSSAGSAREGVEQLLERIADVEPLINSICTLHPEALAQADRLDARAGHRGPLHGRAVLVKDNVDTHDLPTTAGSLALALNQRAGNGGAAVDAVPPMRVTIPEVMLAALMHDLGKQHEDCAPFIEL